MIRTGTPSTEVRKHSRRDKHTPNRDEMLEIITGEMGDPGHLQEVLQTTNAPVGTGNPRVTF